MSITIERVGRRSYIRGNTFAFKDKLRGAGANWDAEQRCWWISNKDKAAAVVAEIKAAGGGDWEQPSVPAGLGDDDVIAGKARYQGREYILVWEGMTRRGGHAAKLAFRDGSKVFWAPFEEVEVTKRYEAREIRGVRESMTFGRLKRLREKYKASGGRPAQGSRYECEECGEWVTRGEGSCWETGAPH